MNSTPSEGMDSMLLSTTKPHIHSTGHTSPEITYISPGLQSNSSPSICHTSYTSAPPTSMRPHLSKPPSTLLHPLCPLTGHTPLPQLLLYTYVFRRPHLSKPPSTLLHPLRPLTGHTSLPQLLLYTYVFRRPHLSKPPSTLLHPLCPLTSHTSLSLTLLLSICPWSRPHISKHRPHHSWFHSRVTFIPSSPPPPPHTSILIQQHTPHRENSREPIIHAVMDSETASEIFQSSHVVSFVFHYL